MSATTNKNTGGSDKVGCLVSAPVIAKRLSVTARYICQLAEQDRIPCVRLGRRCVRFNPAAVARKLGFEWDGEVK